MSDQLSLTPAYRFRSLYRGAMVFALALLTTGCLRGHDLTCNNQEARESIVDAAVESLKTAFAAAGGPVLEGSNGDVTLHDTFETSREGDVLSCHGTLGPKQPNRMTPDVPIDYRVALSNDGNVLISFDKENFGRAYLSLLTLNALMQGAK